MMGQPETHKDLVFDKIAAPALSTWENFIRKFEKLGKFESFQKHLEMTMCTFQKIWDRQKLYNFGHAIQINKTSTKRYQTIQGCT